MCRFNDKIQISYWAMYACYEEKDIFKAVFSAFVL